MRIVEPGDDGPPTEIDPPRLGPGQALNSRVATDCNDAITTDRQRLNKSVSGFRGEDMSVEQDEVWLRRSGVRRYR